MLSRKTWTNIGRKAELTVRRINRIGVHHEMIDRGDKMPKRSEKKYELNA